MTTPPQSPAHASTPTPTPTHAPSLSLTHADAPSTRSRLGTRRELEGIAPVADAGAEQPFVIEHREALLYMLCAAAELEHGLMCEYLFAAFTLKERTDEGVSPEQLQAIERWRQGILRIAGQEMLHLALVSNLLSAVGMSPHLVRPNMPHPARHYPPGVTVTLLPFGEAALRHFMYLERPEGMALSDAEVIVAANDAVPHMTPDSIAPVLQPFATVGHLYRSIEAGMRHLADKWGEARVFVGPARAQARPEHFRWPELVQVTDLASAIRAVETIVEQGEGPRGDWRVAHFGRFKSVFDEYQALKAADPAFEPGRPVLPATVWPGERGDLPRITDPATAGVADLFNVGYEVLLQVLSRFFNNIDETDPQLATLSDVAVGLMFQIVSPLGRYLTELPVGPEHPGRTAGPSFELFYTSDYLLPHRRAAWILLEERMREAAAFARRLKNAGEAPLIAAAASFDQLADRLAAHIPELPG